MSNFKNPNETWKTVIPQIPKEKLIIGNKYLVATTNNQKFMEFKGYNELDEPVFYNNECCCYHIDIYGTLFFTAYGEDLETSYNTNKGECLNNCGDENDIICRYPGSSFGGKKQKSTLLRFLRKNKRNKTVYKKNKNKNKNKKSKKNYKK